MWWVPACFKFTLHLWHCRQMKQKQGGERNFCLPAVATSYTYDIFSYSRRISGSLVLIGVPSKVVFTSALKFPERNTWFIKEGRVEWIFRTIYSLFHGTFLWSQKQQYTHSIIISLLSGNTVSVMSVQGEAQHCLLYTVTLRTYLLCNVKIKL